MSNSSNEFKKLSERSGSTSSAITEVDLYSKKIDLLEHTMLLVQSAIFMRILRILQWTTM
jgi:hypothetical protein